MSFRAAGGISVEMLRFLSVFGMTVCAKEAVSIAIDMNALPAMPKVYDQNRQTCLFTTVWDGKLTADNPQKEKNDDEEI